MNGHVDRLTDAGLVMVIEALLNRRWRKRIVAKVMHSANAEWRAEVRMFNREIRELRKALKARRRAGRSAEGTTSETPTEPGGSSCITTT